MSSLLPTKSAAILGILCAFGAYTIIFPTEKTTHLISDITQSQINVEISEAKLIKRRDSIHYISNTSTENVTKISGSLIYDLTSLFLGNLQSKKGILSTISTNIGQNFEINFGKPATIKRGETVFSIEIKKQREQSHVVNLTDVVIYFSNGTEKRLSTQGTGEF